MSVALTVCKVTSDVIVVVMTIAGIVDCVAMTLAVDLASFMMSLGTCGCGTVAVVVAAADVTGSMMLAVTGVLTIMATAVVIAVAVMSGVVAEVMAAVITVVVVGVTVVTEVDISVVNCVEVPTVTAVWTAGIIITELGADVMTEAIVVTGVVVIASVVMGAAVVTGVIVVAAVVTGAAVVAGVVVTGAGVAIAAAFTVIELETSVFTGVDGVILVAEDETFMTSPGAALAVIIG